MSDPDANPEHFLTLLDPVRIDPAPVRGSTRYQSIQERAMTLTHPSTETNTAPQHSASPLGPKSPNGRRGTVRLGSPQGRRLVLVGAAAAVVLAIVSVLTLVQSPQPSAAATIQKAATATGDVSRFRGHVTKEGGDQTGSSEGTAEVDGSRYRFSYDGDDGPTVQTLIGDTVWETVAGKTTSQPYDAVGNGSLAPFASSSEAVVHASLADSSIRNAGVEQVGSVEATHYEIRPSDTTRAALGDLTPSVLAWFELEYPESVTQIDVWVTENLIRRIRVAAREAGSVTSSTTDFFDFGADIHIEPPA